MHINILTIALFVVLHVVFFAIGLKESENLRPDNDPEREAAILDFFRPQMYRKETHYAHNPMIPQ